MDTIDPEFLQLSKDLAAREAELEAVRAAHQSVENELTQARGQLDAATAEAHQQAQELGRLKAIADRHESLRTQRDQLQQQVTQLATSFQAQTAEAVRSALEQAGEQHAAAASEWAQEREDLHKQIEDLKQAGAGRPEPVAIAPTDLAAHFADVLESLAEGSPSGDAAAKGYSAALTSLDVEAKALLQAPQEGESQPSLVTPAPGQVNPEQLSVVRMSFRLLPRLGQPDGGGVPE